MSEGIQILREAVLLLNGDPPSSIYEILIQILNWDCIYEYIYIPE